MKGEGKKKIHIDMSSRISKANIEGEEREDHDFTPPIRRRMTFDNLIKFYFRFRIDIAV